MVQMNIFRDNPAFSMMEMMSLVKRVPFVPGLLGSIPGMWTPKNIRTETVPIEIHNGTLSVIKADERGAAPKRTQKGDSRELIDVRTVRLAETDRLTASELQNVRAYVDENGQAVTELMQVQDEIALRMGGPTGLLNKLAVTEEMHRMGAIDGLVLDSDGTTIVDWYAKMGVNRPATQDFDFDAATADGEGVIRQTCRAIKRDVKKSLGGIVTPDFKVMALCGDNYFDKMVDNAETRDTYKATAQASDLRNVAQAYDTFDYGGITWVNYQGDEDGHVGVPADEARIFPVLPGAFEVAWSPGEFLDTVNMPGQRVYPLIVPDKDRNMYVDIEIYSYPLFICKRPEALRRARIKPAA